MIVGRRCVSCWKLQSPSTGYVLALHARFNSLVRLRGENPSNVLLDLIFARKSQSNRRVNRMRVTSVVFGMIGSSLTDHARAAAPSTGQTAQRRLTEYNRQAAMRRELEIAIPQHE
jgi:hypothetical protein